MIDPEVLELNRRLKVTTDSCKDEVFDLSVMKFVCLDDQMYLEYKSTGEKFHFKFSESDPNKAEVIHAHKQFCKIIGVPYTFFRNNRPAVKSDMANLWLKSLAPGQNEALYLAKLRKGAELTSIRAILPETHTSLTNGDILSAIINNCPHKLDLETALGDNRDDLTLHARLLVGDEIEISQEKFRMGFALNASELGASDLIIDVFLYHIENKVAFIASYGGDPFFKTKYIGIQPKELKDMLPEFVDRVVTEGEIFKDRLEAGSPFLGLNESCYVAANMKKIPKPFKRAIYLEAESCPDDMGDSISFARHMSLIGKDYDIDKRVQVERAAGKYLNLSFEKL